MNDIDILLEKLSQRYVVFIAFLELQFKGPLLRKLNDPVCDLSIEHELTHHVVLIDEGRLILAKVMKDLHDGL